MGVLLDRLDGEKGLELDFRKAEGYSMAWLGGKGGGSFVAGWVTIRQIV
jgi:hypothetical protein